MQMRGSDGKGRGIDEAAYRDALDQDPKVLVTTSKYPSAGLKTFAKGYGNLVPNAEFWERSFTLDTQMLVDQAVDQGITDLIILSHSTPPRYGVTICHLPGGPTAYFHASQEPFIPIVAEAPPHRPHLYYFQFEVEQQKTLKTIIQNLYTCAPQESTRIISYATIENDIVVRHHSAQEKDDGEVELTQHGPRVIMEVKGVIPGPVLQEVLEFGC